jgi:moderate conductance mechanosensitive channel
VPSAAAPMTDVAFWARNNGLQIVMLVAGAALATRFATWLRDRVTARIDARAGIDDVFARSEAAKHRHAVAQVLTWAALVLIYCLTAVLVIQRLGLPLTGFVAPATVAGVALGFGAQRIVQDLLAGFFVIAERQYGFGDIIRINVAGVVTPVLGTVEEVTLRVIRMRTVNGEVITTPHGQVVQVTNLSRDWARAVIDVPIPAGVDVARVNEMLAAVGDEFYADPDMKALLLDPPSVMGVETLAVDQFNVRMVARTLPGRQFDVGRALRARISQAMVREGIHLPPDLGTEPPTEQDA